MQHREIARSQNISLTTISEYMARAKVAGIKWPLPEDMSEEREHKNVKSTHT